MSRLTDLISQAKNINVQLGQDLEREFKALTSRVAFGLNFERHQPESVELPQRPIRKGDKVRKKAPRGSSDSRDERLWVVSQITKSGKGLTARLRSADYGGVKTIKVDVRDLVVVAEFRDHLYPGLETTETLECSKVQKPFHIAINGENYLVLKTLSYTHRGKVDVIYIDPPYNTGAKDWKYNNDFVDKEDEYRHSKWLAFMERRLYIAKDLLNPKDSVLIVTIDEKEYLRLGLLLEQVFPGQRIQMVSTRINPSGSAREKEFYRVDEYIYFVYIGDAAVQDCFVPGLCISSQKSQNDEGNSSDDCGKHFEKALPSVRWPSLLRSGSGAQREESKLKFYPVLVDTRIGKIVGAGDVLPLSENRENYSPPKGLTAVWPIRKDGSDGRWQLNLVSFRALLEKGFVKIGTISKSGKISLYYLGTGLRKKLDSGELVITGRDDFGGIIVEYSNQGGISGRPRTQWTSKAHSSTDHGATLLRKVIPGRKFPYPKSLYAVEDTLRFFVANKPNAIILDYFAGSGTTVHAVMRLNNSDGGHRQCIAVTNNEVSADEQDALIARGLRPGDSDWEKRGIYDYITAPRIKAVTTGKTPDGSLIEGEYVGVEPFSIAEGFSENVLFCKLTYESPITVTHNLAFSRVATLLWMRAGSKGEIIKRLPENGWAVVENYGLLVDMDCATVFCKAVNSVATVKIAYVVTDDDHCFQAVTRRLPNSVEPICLYESYLSNFELAIGE